ncbi:MAG: 50S ribosomal protein L4 [Deltaproteobacteria bacterium]|nr:50S ribosomal protein L4 [Deltaproteobacteria bacterium]
MPSVDVYNMAGEKVKQIELSEAVFQCELKPHLIHDVVVWQTAKKRLGNAKVKTRSDVSGGGRKPYRQKGTGRARAGTNRSPLWKGGGVIFGPNGRKFNKSVPKKVRSQALKSALSMKLGENEFKIVDKIDLDEVKTKRFVEALNNLEMSNALLVMGNIDSKVSLASRNHPSSKLLDVRGLNVYDILKYRGLIMDLEAVEYVEERLGK